MLSNSWKRESAVLICANCNSVFNVKELEGAFNQEKALVGRGLLHDWEIFANLHFQL